MAGPLSGIRVVELGQVIAVPFCGQLLGDHGADVIKVEPPGTGDVLRQWGKGDGTGDSLRGGAAARNKRSITIDLRTPEGQQLVRDLPVLDGFATRLAAIIAESTSTLAELRAAHPNHKEQTT